jgi:cysteine desulfurase
VRIYLDYNATSPLSAEVIDAISRALRDDFGNPSSIHAFGQRAKAAVDQARSDVAALIGADPMEIVFTSGGTEADNLALRGAFDALESTGRRQGPHGAWGRDRLAVGRTGRHHRSRHGRGGDESRDGDRLDHVGE